MAGQTSVVLVHGAWADGSSWARVIPILQSGGFDVAAVQLPLSSLADDVSVVKRAIALASGNVVLAGHSYGGAVITEAGADPKVTALVYVAAIAPDVGESMAALFSSVPPTPILKHVAAGADGFMRLTAEGVESALAQDIPAAEARVVFAVQGPFAAENFGAAISTAAWKDKPSRYVLSSEDRSLSPALQEKMAARMRAKVTSLPSGHLSLLSRPKEVAAEIIAAAS